MCSSRNIHHLKRQMLHVGQRYGQVMDSDATFALRGRVEEGGLDVEVGGVAASEAVGVFGDEVVLFEFVDDDAVEVDGGAEDEVGGFGFDLDVAVGGYLVIAQISPDTEYCFPGGLACQGVVELIGKLQGVGALGVLRVVEQGARGFAGKIAEGLQVFVLALAMRKHKQITSHLHMRQLTSRITKVDIRGINQIHPLCRIWQGLGDQHGMFDYTMTHLEEYQSSAYRIS